MGVTWGVERGNTRYETEEYYLKKWSAFCAADFCRHFVFPIDDVLYEFKQTENGRVEVSKREDIDVIIGIMALRCGDGTYELFDRITDGIDLYLPDDMGVRRIDQPEFSWNYQRAGSLNILVGLSFYQTPSEDVARLAEELRTAAEFCLKHRLMLGIWY